MDTKNQFSDSQMTHFREAAKRWRRAASIYKLKAVITGKATAGSCIIGEGIRVPVTVKGKKAPISMLAPEMPSCTGSHGEELFAFTTTAHVAVSYLKANGIQAWFDGGSLD